MCQENVIKGTIRHILNEPPCKDDNGTLETCINISIIWKILSFFTALKGIAVNRALVLMHEETHEITLTVSLRRI